MWKTISIEGFPTKQTERYSRGNLFVKITIHMFDGWNNYPRHTFNPPPPFPPQKNFKNKYAIWLLKKKVGYVQAYLKNSEAFFFLKKL